MKYTGKLREQPFLAWKGLFFAQYVEKEEKQGYYKNIKYADVNVSEETKTGPAAGDANDGIVVPGRRWQREKNQ